MNAIKLTKSKLWAMASIALFALALFALHKTLAEFSFAQLQQEVLAMRPVDLIFSILATLTSYALLTSFDFIGVQLSGKKVSLAFIAQTAFIANAFAHALGMSTLTGGAVRARAYRSAGLSVLEITHVVACCGLGFLLGCLLCGGLALLLESQRIAQALPLSMTVLRTIGISLLVLLAGFFALLKFSKQRLAALVPALILPTPSQALALLAASTVELGVAAGALYLLLPANIDISLLSFVGLYLIAICMGLISHVPGGLGVFEATLLLLMPKVSAPVLLGAILVYRAIYYLLPLLLAGIHISAAKVFAGRVLLRKSALELRQWSDYLVAPAFAVAVFVAGASLMISGSLPLSAARLAWLPSMPLGLLEFSHLSASVLGLALLILARGIYQRSDAAWLLTVLGLAGAMLMTALSGFRFELAFVLLALLIPLVLARARFYRASPLLSATLSVHWLRNILLVVLTTLWLGFFVHSHVEYAHALWWQFEFEADAPRMLRAGLAAVLGLMAVTLYVLVQPATVRQFASPAERARARALLQSFGDSTAQLALLPDKQLLFVVEHGKDQGFAMFQQSGKSLIAMADPIGAPEVVQSLAWRLREQADAKALASVFYQVSAVHLPTYLDLGLTCIKLGEEALVSLSDFSLDGSQRAELRQSHRRAVREGASFELLAPAQVPQVLAELKLVSDTWLAEKDAVEKGFSLGFFDVDYLQNFALAIVRKDGAIVAFANVWQSAGYFELSVDLMRFSDMAPKGVMDFLFIELMLWGRAAGFKQFNLGMAPLSGLSSHQLAPVWHKLGSLLWRHGDYFYHFSGLRKYKQKFNPSWQPKYLAAPGGWRMARALFDVSRLISASPGHVRTMAKSMTTDPDPAGLQWFQNS